MDALSADLYIFLKQNLMKRERELDKMEERKEWNVDQSQFLVMTLNS